MRKPVRGLAHDVQPLAGQFAQWRFVEQQAGRFGGAASNPPPQLVQLGQPEPLGILDDHQ